MGGLKLSLWRTTLLGCDHQFCRDTGMPAPLCTGQGPFWPQAKFQKENPKSGSFRIRHCQSPLQEASGKELHSRQSRASAHCIAGGSRCSGQGAKICPKSLIMATVRRNRATCTWKRNLSVGARRSKPTGAPAGGEEEEKPATEHLTGPGESPLLSWHQPHYVFSFSFRLLGGGEVNS